MPVRHCQFTLLGLRHVLYFNLLNFISITPPHGVLSTGTPVWIYSVIVDSRCHLFLRHCHHIRGTASCYKEQILRGASEQVHQSRCCKPRHDVEVAGAGWGAFQWRARVIPWSLAWQKPLIPLKFFSKTTRKRCLSGKV